MSDDQAWSIRYVSPEARREALAAAARRRVSVGIVVDEAIRAYIAAERQPIGLSPAPEPAATWGANPLVVMRDLELWSRNATFRASLRGGSRAGKITAKEQQAWKRAYDQTLRQLYDATSHKSDTAPLRLPSP